jgi:hypothetical protein
MGYPGGTRGVGDRDLDVVPAHSLDRLDRGARLTYQGSGIILRQEEGEAHLAILGHGEIPDHSGGEQIVVHSGVADAREGRGDLSLNRLGH